MAEFYADGLAQQHEGISYEPVAGRRQAENRIFLLGLDTPLDAQWTEKDRWQAETDGHGILGPEVIYSFEDDFANIPFPQGNPIDDLIRCGLRKQQADDASLVRYHVQVAPCEEDEVVLTFDAFTALPNDRLFAVKLYGAEWNCLWDDTSGLRRRMLPNGFVLRCKNSRESGLNNIRLAPNSRCFAVEIQGPGISTENLESYGSFVGLYHLPKAGQPLRRKDRWRMLLREVLPKKLEAFQRNPAGASSPIMAQLLPRLTPPIRPPRREVPRGATPGIEHIPHFADSPVRQSWLYQIYIRPFLEAVYTHSYTGFNPAGSLLLANLIWDAEEKGEVLEQTCSGRFNTDALPPELQDLLFDPNPPFAKLRFQINIQPYMNGWKQVEETTSDGKKQKITVPDPTQCLRPHYAVANMPCANASGRDKLCPAVVGGLFAMRLYGTYFIDNPNGGTSHFPQEFLPAGFSLRTISTHEQWQDAKKKIPAGCWVASPNNCKIANTDNHNISQSFYSAVMGRCMQYCDDYRDINARPWDAEVTAIVTLHILLENVSGSSDADIVRHNAATGSLSEIAQKCYDAWETKHRSDAIKRKNPFEEFYNLLRTDGASFARTGPHRH
jgi:hypothetical protein